MINHNYCFILWISDTYMYFKAYIWKEKRKLLYPITWNKTIWQSSKKDRAPIQLTRWHCRPHGCVLVPNKVPNISSWSNISLLLLRSSTGVARMRKRSHMILRIVTNQILAWRPYWIPVPNSTAPDDGNAASMNGRLLSGRQAMTFFFFFFSRHIANIRNFPLLFFYVIFIFIYYKL